MREGFRFIPADLHGAYLIENIFTEDNRGCFQKNFEKNIFLEGGIHFRLSESFCTVSRKNVIRGLHFQLNNPQAKLITVLQGRVWDVIVDLRMRSETYRSWTVFELSWKNHRSLYVPKGFAHGFVSLDTDSMVMYQCDGAYDRQSDTGILFNDAGLGIDWPVDETVAVHSQRDLGLMTLKEYERNPMKI